VTLFSQNCVNLLPVFFHVQCKCIKLAKFIVMTVFVGQKSSAPAASVLDDDDDDDDDDDSMLLILDELDAALQQLELKGRLLEERIRSGQYVVIITTSRVIWQ